MRTTTFRTRTRESRVAVAAVVLGLVLTACGGDDDADDTASDDVQETDDAAADAADDAETELGDAAADAEQVLEDAGIDVDAEGVGEVSFLGTTYVFTAAESFGCFILEDGGSDGAVSFTGTAEDGSEIEVDWAGDSTDFAYVDIVIADGTEYQTGFADGGVEVSVDGSTAEVSTQVGQVGVIDGQPESLSGTFTCG